MADWGYFPAVTRFAADDTAGTSYKQSVTGGAANTKGSYQQYVASTPFDVQGIWMFTQADVANNNGLVDISIGAAASEKVIVPNIFLGVTGVSFTYYAPMFFPVQIPAGTRIALRCQGTNASTVFYIKLLMVSENGCGPFQTGTDYGTVAASSRGTAVAAAGSINTKGSWVQLVASTGSEMIYAVVMAYGAINSSFDFDYDIGIGGSGSEQVVIPDVFAGVNATAASMMGGQIIGTPLRIPAGTRIAARCASSSAGTILNISLIGFA